MIARADISCPSCGAAEIRLLGHLPNSQWFAGKNLPKPLPGGSLFRCKHCQLKFRSPVESDTNYRKLYDNAVVSTWSETNERPDWGVIQDYLRRHLAEGASVLDFGCYTGGLLGRLGKGYRKHGVEINEQAAAIAAANGNAIVWASLENIPEKQRFDVIMASDVIEHIARPLQFLKAMSRYLSDDGVLLFTTGDADNPIWNRFGANWWYCFYPEHISFISRVWLEKSAPLAGLRLQRCETFRYTTLPVGRLLSDWLLTCLYGLFPRIYLGIKERLEVMTGTKKHRGVPGNGISRDHLFIVLCRETSDGQ